MPSLNSTKPDQVLRASHLFSLGQDPEMLKTVCFLPIPQNWTSFLHMLSNYLQRFTCTIHRGWYMADSATGLQVRYAECQRCPWANLWVLKMRCPKRVMGLMESVKWFVGYMDLWWVPILGCCAPCLSQPLSPDDNLSILSVVRKK